MSNSLLTEEETLAFKADFFPMTVIKLSTGDINAIKKQLSATIVSAPNYFKQAPVVIDISGIGADKSTIDLKTICALLREQQMIPVGVRGLEKAEQNIAISQGLALINAPKALEKKVEPSLTTGTKTKPRPEAPQKIGLKTRLITTPIRSGSQIYAKDGDLIVMAAVNTGAECFADGNIHIYGPLRGKALAGANGNTQARIFCESLEADLISISGRYLTSDQIKIPKTKKPMIQIYLKNDKLHIEGI